MFHIKIDCSAADVDKAPAKIVGAFLHALSQLLPNFALVISAGEMASSDSLPSEGGIRIVYAANCTPVIATLILTNLVTSIINKEAPMESLDETAFDTTIDSDLSVH